MISNNCNFVFVVVERRKLFVSHILSTRFWWNIPAKNNSDTVVAAIHTIYICTSQVEATNNCNQVLLCSVEPVVFFPGFSKQRHHFVEPFHYFICFLYSLNYVQCRVVALPTYLRGYTLLKHFITTTQSRTPCWFFYHRHPVQAPSPSLEKILVTHSFIILLHYGAKAFLRS